MLQIFRIRRRLYYWPRLFTLRVCLFRVAKLFSGVSAGLSVIISMWSRLAPSPLLLAYHFFSVALYSIKVLFTDPRPRLIEPTVEDRLNSGTMDCKPKVQMVVPSLAEYPELIAKSLAAVSFVCFQTLLLGFSD
jgi:hypothetical protein